jgi:hypothetical protein
MLIHDNFNNFYREKDEIILKHPRTNTYLGQVIRDNISDDEKHSLSFKGYIMFNNNKFDTFYDLMKSFLYYLSISRSLKRTLIFMEFYIKGEKVLLEDYIQIEEINRYTNIKRSYKASEFSESFFNFNGNCSIQFLKTINYDLLLILNDAKINNNEDFDDFTLHNVIQLKDELNYKVEEYILENDHDKFNFVINHTNQIVNLESTSILLINELYESLNVDILTKEILKLFSGIYRIHVNPPELIQKFSRRYWHHWDEDFKVIT